MANHFGRYGYVDPSKPEAAGICDRGGEVRKLRDLLPEMEWRGGRLVPNGLRVCRHHMDVPNPQIGGIVPLRTDPEPVLNPRPDRDNEPDIDILTDPQGNPLLDVRGQYLFPS